MRQLNEHDLKWAVRRLPKNVRDLLVDHGQKLMLAGGYIRSVIMNEEVKDIDLFGPSKGYSEACAKALAGDGKIYESQYAFSVYTKPMTQFIHRWSYEEPEVLIESFDFTIASAALWYCRVNQVWKSLCDDSYYEDLAAKRLVYRNPIRNEDAGGSILRVLKFYQRGYRIPLDSFAAVIERLDRGVSLEECDGRDRSKYAKVICGLLREVDPNTPMEGFPH